MTQLSYDTEGIARTYDGKFAKGHICKTKGKQLIGPQRDLSLQIVTKICTKCHKLKPLYAFNKKKTISDGHTTTCKECTRKYAREQRILKGAWPDLQRYRKLRTAVLQKLGGKCVYCGCNVLEALEINHVNGGGAKENKGAQRRRYLNDILNGKRDDLELTCRVCNALHYMKLKGFNGWTVSWTKPEEKPNVVAQ